MKTYVILLAGGSGTRMNAAVNKALLPLCGVPVLLRSLNAFLFCADEILIAVRPEDESAVLSLIRGSGISVPCRLIYGGTTRQGSVLNCLRAISPDPQDIMLIHDAARCLVSAALIERVIQSVREFGTGIPGIPATSTYKTADASGFITGTPDRSALYEIQTPQGFQAKTILDASMKAAEDGLDCTDDAGVLEYYQIPVKLVPGESTNLKLTRQEDLRRAAQILEGDASTVRVGMGYDVHRLVSGRKLILCGVDVPHDLGLLGHSDADVALHALMDAMLGACALGDIGKHFPDTDERYRGISSLLLLKETNQVLLSNGFAVHNADITIAAQKPKLLPYIDQMRANIAEALDLSLSDVSVKATTTEKLGFEGRMEGISAYAVCTVKERA